MGENGDNRIVMVTGCNPFTRIDTEQLTEFSRVVTRIETVSLDQTSSVFIVLTVYREPDRSVDVQLSRQSFMFKSCCRDCYTGGSVLKGGDSVMKA